MSSNVDLMTKAPEVRGFRIDGISHLAVAVGEIDGALDFYCNILGFRQEPEVTLPDCGAHAVVAAASGQRVALCRSDAARPSAESGVHNAYRVTTAGREAVLERVARLGVEVFSYREMRPAEATDNCYFHDPFGNRIQLVVTEGQADGSGARAIHSIDHAAVQTIDIEWAEKFYVEMLGLPVDCNIGRRTADYLFARRWKEGKENVAPGIMRLEKRYSTIHGTDPVPRPNMQLFVRTGAEVLGIYLTNKPYQAPPEEWTTGTPRTAFRVDRQTLAALAAKLDTVQYVPSAFKEHPAVSPVRQSLYCRDPGANFIEFCC
jgi:catechol 2,3-dioxygenase-like lactoylglutathione lyase family enzyme